MIVRLAKRSPDDPGERDHSPDSALFRSTAMLHKKFHHLKIKASHVLKAMARGQQVSDDWQAQYIEIALLPAVNRRWQAANRDRFESLILARVPGKPHIGYTPDDNRAVIDWTQFAGYALAYGPGASRWNSVRADCYSHSPSTTWDGIRRETYHSFIYDLGACALSLRDGKEPPPSLLAELETYGVELIDDLPVALSSNASQQLPFAL
jgi:hypothetical protein